MWYLFSEKLGNVLCLDGRVQATEFDEYSYQEMISFVPLNCHKNPERVLIIGGGDGGVARECDKHPLVKEIVQYEIDEVIIQQIEFKLVVSMYFIFKDVCKVSKLYLPNMAKGFESSKLKLHIGDGFEFMKNHKQEFDVIICDSSDNKGPAEVLWNEAFYQLMKEALKPNGLVCCQGEDNWFYPDIVVNVMKFAGEIFPSISYCLSQVPTFPAGTCGYILCSLEKVKLHKLIHISHDM